MSEHPQPFQVEDPDLQETLEEQYVRKRLIFGLTVETLSVLGVGFFVVLLGLLVYVLGLDIRDLQSLGYIGVFLITFIGAASIVLPMPGLAATAGGGALLDPLYGIPAPICVGFIVGLAEALGEFTGYAMGFGGAPMIERRRLYRIFHGWMLRRGYLAMFALSAIPNPVFDIAGVAAGAVRMPLAGFFLSVLAGKTVKSLYIAGGAALIFRLFDLG